MGTIKTCANCKKTNRYSTSEIKNIGTLAVPVWSVTCCFCGNIIKEESSYSYFPQNKDLTLVRDKESGGVAISLKKEKVSKKANAFKRAEKGDIREYWVQLFFKEYYKDYGFKIIEGPYDTGPDFMTKIGNKKIGVEIETDWKTYLIHKHHKNSAFSIVKYLIVLTHNEPTSEKKRLLPENILHVDIEKFVPWFRIKCKEYSEKKEEEQIRQRLMFILELIQGEFQRRFVDFCNDKDRSMANCPDCTNCTYAIEIPFERLAIDFIVYYEYPIWSDNFSLSDIKPECLDIFMQDNIFA